jgi:hypothetical protein
MKSIKYVLEVYKPLSVDDVWISFTSQNPFISIHVGDIINPGLWEGSEAPQKILRVLNIEHAIWETRDHITHKVMIFTEEVKGIRDLKPKNFS